MKIEPSGIVQIGECNLRLPGCLALTPAPVMAIWAAPGHAIAATVCRSCLEEMVRLGEWENPGAKLSRRFDIAVYDKDERLQLVVDVKDSLYKQEADAEQWATRIRRNLVHHSAVPIYVYFLLAAYPAPFFLWGADEASEALPHYCFDVQPLMPRLHESKMISDSQQQVDTVHAWLTILIERGSEVAGQAESQPWLHESGLWAAIEGGTVVKRAEKVETRALQAA